MARSIHSNSQQTRKRILTHASSLFAQKGMKGASVREIANKSQVNVAMVSHYFGGKQGLYDACLTAMYDELAKGQSILTEALKKGQDIRRIVAYTIRAAFSFACEHRDSIRLLLRDIVDRGEFNPQQRNQQLLPFLHRMAGLLAVDETSQPRIRMALQSLIFLTARYSICTQQELSLISGDGDHPQQAIAEHLVHVAWNMLEISE